MLTQFDIHPSFFSRYHCCNVLHIEVKRRLERKRTEKRNKYFRYNTMETVYDEFMNTYLQDTVEIGQHPLFYCSPKEYRYYQHHTILLTNPTTGGGNLNNRSISYQIKSIGKAIVYTKKDNEIHIQIERTSKNLFFIMIKASDLVTVDNIKLYEFKNKIHHRKLTPSNKYVVLCYCNKSKKKESNSTVHFNAEYIQQMKNNCRNLVSVQNKKHHGSEGTIFGFGYSAKYDKLLEGGVSVKKYAHSEYNMIVFIETFVWCLLLIT